MGQNWHTFMDYHIGLHSAKRIFNLTFIAKSTLQYNSKSEDHCPPVCFKFDDNSKWKKIFFTVSII